MALDFRPGRIQTAGTSDADRRRVGEEDARGGAPVLAPHRIGRPGPDPFPAGNGPREGGQGRVGTIEGRLGPAQVGQQHHEGDLVAGRLGRADRGLQA